MGSRIKEIPEHPREHIHPDKDQVPQDTPPFPDQDAVEWPKDADVQSTPRFTDWASI